VTEREWNAVREAVRWPKWAGNDRKQGGERGWCRAGKRNRERHLKRFHEIEEKAESSTHDKDERKHFKNM
jgi:hypothetical protein